MKMKVCLFGSPGYLRVNFILIGYGERLGGGGGSAHFGPSSQLNNHNTKEGN